MSEKKPTYIDMSTLGFELGYRGPNRRGAARDWVLAQSNPPIPRFKVGRGYRVKWADVVDRVEGLTPKKKTAPAGTGSGLERSL